MLNCFFILYETLKFLIAKEKPTPNDLRTETESGMVFILDGCSFHYAHTWSKSGISIC